jgi:hypothetical protein
LKPPSSEQYEPLPWPCLDDCRIDTIEIQNHVLMKNGTLCVLFLSNLVDFFEIADNTCIDNARANFSQRIKITACEKRLPPNYIYTDVGFGR